MKSIWFFFHLNQVWGIFMKKWKSYALFSDNILPINFFYVSSQEWKIWHNHIWIHMTL